jgi:hypothetical protein
MASAKPKLTTIKQTMMGQSFTIEALVFPGAPSKTLLVIPSPRDGNELFHALEAFEGMRKGGTNPPSHVALRTMLVDYMVEKMDDILDVYPNANATPAQRAVREAILGQLEGMARSSYAGEAKRQELRDAVYPRLRPKILALRELGTFNTGIPVPLLMENVCRSLDVSLEIYKHDMEGGYDVTRFPPSGSDPTGSVVRLLYRGGSKYDLLVNQASGFLGDQGAIADYYLLKDKVADVQPLINAVNRETKIWQPPKTVPLLTASASKASASKVSASKASASASASKASASASASKSAPPSSPVYIAPNSFLAKAAIHEKKTAMGIKSSAKPKVQSKAQPTTSVHIAPNSLLAKAAAAAKTTARTTRRKVLVHISNSNNNSPASISSNEEERQSIRKSKFLSAKAKAELLAELPTKEERLYKAALQSARNLKRENSPKENSYETKVDKILANETMNEDTKMAIIASLAPNET